MNHSSIDIIDLHVTHSIDTMDFHHNVYNMIVALTGSEHLSHYHSPEKKEITLFKKIGNRIHIYEEPSISQCIPPFHHIHVTRSDNFQIELTAHGGLIFQNELS